jgi:lysophospholipase L1-like esterase
MAMHIAFFGDSLTEGLTGTSFFPLLERRLPDDRLYNFGRGGDTVISLYRRISRMAVDRTFSLAFLWVGVNDILARQSLSYSLLKLARRQPWARSEKEFQEYYRKSLTFLLRLSPRVFTVPPFLIGENRSSPRNRRLDRMSTIIREISAGTAGTDFLDIRKSLFLRLPERDQAEYRPKGILYSLWGNKALPPFLRKEKTRNKEPFFLTTDGVHLNHLGAELISDSFFSAVEGSRGDL